MRAGRWAGERTKEDGGETYFIEQCDSPLALRIALRDPDGPAATKVLITGLDDKELSEDILVRLAKRKLFPIDAWQIVKSLFQAHAVDPRLDTASLDRRLPHAVHSRRRISHRLRGVSGRGNGLAHPAGTRHRPGYDPA